MGVVHWRFCSRHHHIRRRVVSAFAILFVFFFFSSDSAVSLTRSAGGGFGQEVTSRSENPGRVMGQKRLSGPGSSPPSCKSKCESCEPCKPVHVPIQPGLSTPLEYYPEAWRCKCGNKLYMP